MEPDELKLAWQALGRQLERQQAIEWELLREHRLARAQRHLRPLVWGQGLQFLLGVGLIALGVACWTRNTDVPGLLLGGVLVHAFGVANAVMAAITLCLAAGVDSAAPVLRIQRRMAVLRCVQALNAGVCAAPWWVMWIPVVVAIAGVQAPGPETGNAPWLLASLAIGTAGLVATWGWSLWRWRRHRDLDMAPDATDAGDGCDGIGRAQRLLEEIARFERG